MSTAIIYDLSRFAALLPVEYNKLGKALRQWRDGHSIVADLRVARDLIEKAISLSDDRSTDFSLLQLSALHTAVMAYARSLERKSHHRGSLPVKQQMTAQQLAMHNKIVNLRDEGVGHHGPAGFIRPLSEDRALLIQEQRVWQPAILSRRTLFEPEHASLMLLHIEQTISLAEVLVKTRQQLFEKMFKEHNTKDVVADALLSSELSDAERALFPKELLQSPRSGHVVKIFSDRSSILAIEPFQHLEQTE